jgi:hypothetical protein
VRGVPGLAPLRQRLLPLASDFAALPDSVRAKYERPEAVYCFGWSHGREMFNGQPGTAHAQMSTPPALTGTARRAPRRADVAKGSYYNNPLLDRPTEDAATMARFPAYCMPNVWPAGGDCPDLEPAFKALGRLVVDVGVLVGDQIDRYAATAVPGYPAHYLHTVIRSSLACKVRWGAGRVAAAPGRTPTRFGWVRHGCCTTFRAP